MKRSKIVRAFALLTVVFALSVLLIACGGDGSTTDATTTDSAVTDAAERELQIFADEKCLFTIIRPDKPDDIRPYVKFHQNFQNALNTSVKLDVDDFYKGHEYDAEKYEILCGTVDYPEAENACSGLGFDEYRINVVGNKIVIASGTEDGIAAAFDAFCAYAKENLKDGVLTVTSEFVLTGKVEATGFNYLLDDIPAAPVYSGVALSHCGDGYEQVTLSGTTAEGFAEYCTVLESNGFTLYAENEMAENSFVTYTKGELNVHAYYTPHNAETRVIVSEGTLLPWKDEVKYTKVCEPTVTLMGLEKSGSGGGLGMIIGLEDGSFIIIDGGNNKKIEAEDLANTLKSLAPDPSEVIIRAWIFTHGHGDHTGAFIQFSSLYAASGIFKVEKFIYNFCDAPSQRVYGGISYTNTLNAMNKYWKNTVRYKALTGEVYRFAGCDIEMLYCMSDFIPQIIGEEKGITDIDKTKIDGNIESIVFRASVGGQKFLVTGDTSKVCVDEMCDRYGSYLKSDILQVPHHGHNRNTYRARNGTVEFYMLVDPSLVLWPSETSGFTDRLKWNTTPGANYEANYYLVNKLHVKQVIVAGKTTRTLTLPYTDKI